jgi:hypothetical protein
METEITTPRSSWLEQVSGEISRALARRVSRRDAIGRFGRTAVAVSLGGAGMGVFAAPAAAHLGASCGDCQGSCCDLESVWCTTINNGVNACPSGSYGCGSWSSGNTCAGGGVLRYADCCGGCNNGLACTCIGGRPSCCRHQQWTNGASNNCADNHIKCRRSFCA